MPKITLFNNGVSIDRSFYPSNSLLFSVVANNHIKIALVGSNTSLYQAIFSDFTDEDNVIYTSPKAVIDDLSLNNKTFSVSADEINVNLTDLENLAAETNSILNDQTTQFNNIDTSLDTLVTKFIGVTRIPSFSRVTNSGTIPSGSRSISVYNTGTSDGSLLGTTLKKGENITFTADGEGDTLSAISYDGVGTELLIVTIV